MKTEFKLKKNDIVLIIKSLNNMMGKYAVAHNIDAVHQCDELAKNLSNAFKVDRWYGNGAPKKSR